MKLELKYCIPYLEHGVKIYEYRRDLIDLKYKYVYIGEMSLNANCTNPKNFNDGYLLALRPLSDLTKQIEHNGNKFVAIEYFVDSENPYLKDEIIETLTLDKEPYYINYGYATKLIEWHFDLFGLIEKGLAIDINTLK